MGYNLPDDVSPSSSDAPWNQKKGYYYEISISGLVVECGGREAILGHDNPYDYMIETQEKLCNRILKQYKEVGEVHTETIQDYVDTITEVETQT